MHPRLRRGHARRVGQVIGADRDLSTFAERFHVAMMTRAIDCGCWDLLRRYVRAAQAEGFDVGPLYAAATAGRPEAPALDDLPAWAERRAREKAADRAAGRSIACGTRLRH